jgi:Tfp pilus assembly protein PilF
MRKALILAMGYLEAGLDAAARDAAREALDAGADDGETHFILGCALERLEQPDAALPHLRRAAALCPDDATIRHALGLCLYRRGAPEEALGHLRAAAVDANPDFAETLGACLMTLLRPDEAEPHLRRVAEARPHDPTAWANLGAALVDVNRCEDAIAACDRALAIDPDHVEAHMSRALANLLAGDWAAAWPEYEWRWQRPVFAAAYPETSCPRWRGEVLGSGAQLWVRGEQGFGDHVQFARFVPLAAARANCPVVVSAPPALHRLLGGIPGVAACVATNAAPPGASACIPMMSLPGLFGTVPGTVPGPFPYLAAPELPCLPDAGGRPRVGVVWGDKPKPRSRAIDPNLVAAALDGLGLAVFSLQADDRADDIPAGSGWIDLRAEMTDFAATAALIGQMDAVISVDTAALHLAGGLGVPVYILLVKGADWRWMRDRDRTPWYPSARLLRQERPRDWSRPLAELRAALAARDYDR